VDKWTNDSYRNTKLTRRKKIILDGLREGEGNRTVSDNKLEPEKRRGDKNKEFNKEEEQWMIPQALSHLPVSSDCPSVSRLNKAVFFLLNIGKKL
jgi:hypothetical protein